jgi:hypothetical protein
MEKLLHKKEYICKPITGLNMFCKPIAGLSINL